MGEPRRKAPHSLSRFQSSQAWSSGIIRETRRKVSYKLSRFQSSQAWSGAIIGETRRKVTYSLSRFQSSQTWLGGIIGENKKKGHLLPFKISKQPGRLGGIIGENKKKGRLQPVKIPSSQALSGGVIGENKKKGHLLPVKIPKQPSMVRWDHCRKQEERSLTFCQDSKAARHGQVESLEKTRKVTYNLSRFQSSQGWSGGIIGETKKEGHLQAVEIPKQPGMVRWNHWRKQERSLTCCQDSKAARHGQGESLKKTREKATYSLSRFQSNQALSGGIIEENKEKGHLQPVKIPKQPSMVRWNH